MLARQNNHPDIAQRVGQVQQATPTLPPRHDPRGYRYFESRYHWHLLMPFLRCTLFLTTEEFIVRKHDLFQNFRETTLNRRTYSRIMLRGHFGRYHSLEFHYVGGGGYYHLPYLFTPTEAYAIQQAFLFLPTY